MRFFSFALLMFVATTQSASAFCTWGIFPPEREYEPVDATEVFISYDDGVQTLVLQPEWQGDVTDFTIVYPTPSKPEIEAGPSFIFDELDRATNPWLPVPMAMMEEDMMADDGLTKTESVTVVEEKQVGEYEVTVLTATDADDLVEYLEDNDYNYTKKDADKVSYYVDQGGFYFIALKIDASFFEPKPWPVEPQWLEDDVVAQSIAPQKIMMPEDWFWGQLSPLEITFATDAPQLPMRTLKSDMPEMTFDLYTLSDRALYIPGIDTVYSNIVDAEFLSQTKSIADYNPKGKWLVRQEVKFNPSNSDADVYTQMASNNDFTTVDPGSQVRFNPSELDTATGIVAGSRGQVVYTDGRTVVTFTRSLKIGMSGEDVRVLQQFLNDEGFEVSASGAGAPGLESMYFGDKTKQALIKYQNFYRADILTPVGLSVGTGYFGPSTIGFMNR